MKNEPIRPVMSGKFELLIFINPALTFKGKNRHKIKRRKTVFIATKFIAKSPNFIPLPIKVPAPRSIKFTARLKTKMNYLQM